MSGRWVRRVYSKSIRLLRFLTRRVLMLFIGLTSSSSGHGGSSSTGSRSSAPRATILLAAFLGEASVECDVGSSGIASGEGPRAVPGRLDGIKREFRRSLLVLGSGAVRGVRGVAGVGGMFPARALRRESHFFVDGVMAMRARDSFCEMERRRLCGLDLMMGDAALLFAFSNGSEERKAWAGDWGVSGGKGASGLGGGRVLEPR